MWDLIQGLIKRWAKWKTKSSEPEHVAVPMNWSRSDDKNFIGITAQEVGMLFPGTVMEIDRSSESRNHHMVAIDTIGKLIETAVHDIGRVAPRLQELVDSGTLTYSSINVLIALTLLQERAEAIRDDEVPINVVEDVWEGDSTEARTLIAYTSVSIYLASRFAAKKKTYYLTVLAGGNHWPLNEKDIVQLIRQEVIR